MLIFEWDETKAKNNLTKHRVSFAEAESVFYDPESITIDDPDHSGGEQRYVDVGTSSQNRILVVVYTEREDRIRIITVRKATRTERKIYEQNG
ncbi:MAG: BrnT family toxin [Acidobacteriota bacterium]